MRALTILLLVVIATTATATMLTNDEKEQLVTVFFQGNHASRSQATKYTGDEGVDIRISETLKDHVYIPGAPQILYNLFSYDDLACIGYGTSWNPLQLATKAGHYMSQWYYGVQGTTHYPHNYITHDNVGGEQDVTQCVNAIKACIKAHPDKKLVLFGCSRGAATVITSLVFLSEEEQHQIKLVIAEAPFDTVPSVLATYRFTGSLILTALENLSLYEKHQLSPLDAVNAASFPLDVPLVFVTSDVDTTVPRANTMKLIDTLRTRNHKAMHHIELKNSHHSAMSMYDEKDSETYHSTIHALYKQYCF